MARIRIKMCGTTTKEDAEHAVSLGVDGLGFIFVEKSPRFVEPAFARELIAQLPPFISRVGVFVNSSFEEIKEIVSKAGLTQVQLHGSETPALCRELGNWNKGMSICKAFSIGKSDNPPDINAYNDVIDSLLLDTYMKGVEGGTGKVFDWKLVDRLSPTKPLILAGGLNPGNVMEAITTVKPYAIDINSGVEDRPGIKNHQLLDKLFANVRLAEKQLFSSSSIYT